MEESEAEVLNGLKTLCKDEETNEEAAETMRQGLPKLWDVAPEIARTVERPFQFEEFEEAAKRWWSKEEHQEKMEFLQKCG